jgi:peptidoglycan/xylan/chitin deacetylase (PgdA/CDA1 family)
MNRLKKHIKSALAAAAYKTGGLERYLTGQLSGRAAVLMYHRVLPDSARADSFSTDGIVVSPDTFARQMRLLSQRLRPLSMAEFLACLRTDQFPRNACLVTFDDGWFDNHQYALPILAETRVPATVFIATDYIGSESCFWQERLSRHLFRATTLGPAATDFFRNLECSHLTSLSVKDRKHAIRQVINGLKKVPSSRISELEEEGRALLMRHDMPPTGPHMDRFMNWEQVDDLQRSGVISIGSHCRSHTPLTMLSAASAQRELVESRRIIATHIGMEPDTIAYPNGDCTSEVAELAASSGYSAAFSTDRGYASSGNHPHMLKRINIHENSCDTDATFLARVALLT